MSRIRSGNTKPELTVRRFLHARGFRYRLRVKDLPGKPDIVFPKLKTVVFIHGCFWHGHDGCRFFVVPKTRTDWWLNKIQKNQLNDLKVAEQLRDAGWHILQLWECELKGGNADRRLNELQIALRSM